jgi:competence protein ComEC
VLTWTGCTETEGGDGTDTTDDDNDNDGSPDDDSPTYELPDGFEVVFYDVWQGDAALLRFPGGATMLIDGGLNDEGDFTILPHFDTLHLDFLDYVVVTHPDADHCGGLDEVLAAVDVGEVWENGETKDTESWTDFSDLVDELGIPRRIVHRDDVAEIDGCDVLVMNADQGWDEVNPNSVVLAIDCESITVLMSADITEEAQADLIDEYDDLLLSTVIKVPHHGSEDHSPLFAEYVAPEIAVISVGAGNDYGHPDAAVVAEWEAVGATVYRTDQDGTVVVRAKQGVFEVTTGQ